MSDTASGLQASRSPAVAALEVSSLSKSYPGRGGARVTAVDGVSFSVAAGEIVGLLGPNGAGKTTTMQLAIGLLEADAGTVRLFGGDPSLLENRAHVGWAPDAPKFPPRLTGLQILELHAELAGLTRGQARADAERVCDQLGLREVATRACGTYSKGQAQRLGLAQALLADPRLVLLDEPTAGLDPAAVAALRGLLLELRARGVAVLLNSHQLGEVEKVCDRVLFLKRGRVLRDHVVGQGARMAEVRLANAAQVADKLPVEGDFVRVPITSENELPAVVKRVVEAGGAVLEARAAGAELERLYLELVEGKE